MPSSESHGVAPGAWAVVKDDTPQIFLAENAQVISRLIALKIVAGADPAVFAPGSLAVVRDHLLHERWAEAVVAWMEATDTLIDVYEEFVPVWTESDLDREVASMAIRMSRLFGSTAAPSAAPSVEPVDPART